VVRRFLTPKWLFRHVLALAAVVTCLRLGWWQFDEARATGDLQNIGYTLEWPAFAVAVVFVWVRLMQWEVNPPKKGARLTAPLHAQARPAPSAPVPSHRPHTTDDADVDDRHARYNRYLAELAAEEDQERRT
jgi:DNA-binding transcriptional regulator of glucitol operon